MLPAPVAHAQQPAVRADRGEEPAVAELVAHQAAQPARRLRGDGVEKETGTPHGLVILCSLRVFTVSSPGCPFPRRGLGDQRKTVRLRRTSPTASCPCT